MYVKLLEEAVAKRRGQVPAPLPIETVIDLPVEAYLDGGYIADAMHKIEIYQKIAAVRNNEDLENLLDELIDRFGEPTRPVRALLDIARIKNYARQLGVRGLSVQSDALHIALPEGKKLPIPALIQLDRVFGRRIGPLPEGDGYRIHLLSRERRDILGTTLEVVQMASGA